MATHKHEGEEESYECTRVMNDKGSSFSSSASVRAHNRCEVNESNTQSEPRTSLSLLYNKSNIVCS